MEETFTIGKKGFTGGYEIAQLYAKNPTATLDSNRNLQKQLSTRLESLGNGLAQLGISLDQDLPERAITR